MRDEAIGRDETVCETNTAVGVSAPSAHSAASASAVRAAHPSIAGAAAEPKSGPAFERCLTTV